MNKTQIDTDKTPTEFQDESSLVMDVIRYTVRGNEAALKAFKLIIILLLAALIGTNMAWLYVFQSYDYVSYELEAADGGNANFIGNDGDIHNGESQSKDKEKEKF